MLSHLAYVRDSENELSAYVSSNAADLRSAMKIDSDIYVERNTSTTAKIALLRKFFRAYGANPEDLVFYLKDRDADNQSEEEGTRYELRRRYWNFALPFIQQAHGEQGSFSNSTGSKENWLSGFFGIGGFSLTCAANYNLARVELYLGNSNKERNKEAFDYLYGYKSEIEQALGRALNWNRLDHLKASGVSVVLNDVSIESETDWTQMAKFHAEWSKKFYDIIVPYLKKKY